MDTITLIEEIKNRYNKIFEFTEDIFTFEHNFYDFTLNTTKLLFAHSLEQLDKEFLNSLYRKDNYESKEIIKRPIITCFGEVLISYRVYINKHTRTRYSLIKELLNLKPYQRITDEAEYEIIKYAMHSNMTQASKHAIPNITLSRSWVSKLLKKLNGSIHRDIKRSLITPKTLYIEMDEIHANLQHGGNQICPCAIVHEGHKYLFKKRKELKNLVYFATAKGSYKELWNEIYDYVDKRYDIDKIDYIFISGDGASGIKQFEDAFPNAIFVLDKFHCKKYLKKIFKDKHVLSFALEYLRNNNINDFNLLVDGELEKEEANTDSITKARDYLLNNIEGIINQTHEEYKCSCSMESHVNHGFARYITSSPYGFSLEGLNNKLKLLVYNANKIELTYKDYINLKYNENELEMINKQINNLQNINYKYSNLLRINKNKPSYDYNVDLPIFDNNITNLFLSNLISFKNI